MTQHIRLKAAAAVRQAWENAKTNTEAEHNLLTMMQGDEDLWREVLAPFEKQAAALAVQRRKIQQRSYLFNRPSAPDTRVKMLARTNAETLLDSRLPSGKRLGDATKDDLAEAEQHYSDASVVMAARASFYHVVAAKLRGQSTVAQVWSAAELEEIKNAN